MSGVEPTDDALVARVKAGEAEAFAILAERHRAGLVRLASFLIGDLDEAESIAQEAITRALAGIDGYDPQTPFLAWIRGIVLNLARQHQRRLRRHAVVTDPSRLAAAPGPEGLRQGVLSAILRDELATSLWLAVGQLPETYREAVVLHYVEGMDYSRDQPDHRSIRRRPAGQGAARPQPAAGSTWTGGRHMADCNSGNRRRAVTILRVR